MAKLYETKDRSDSHAQLEKLLADHPRAECREDPNAAGGLCYTVWDGPDERRLEQQPAAPARTLSDEELQRLADLLRAKP